MTPQEADELIRRELKAREITTVDPTVFLAAWDLLQRRCDMCDIGGTYIEGVIDLLAEVSE